MLWVSADDNIVVTVERVRWSSAVDSAVELVCTGLAHKARAALSCLSGPTARSPVVLGPRLSRLVTASRPGPRLSRPVTV